MEASFLEMTENLPVYGERGREQAALWGSVASWGLAMAPAWLGRVLLGSSRCFHTSPRWVTQPKVMQGKEIHVPTQQHSSCVGAVSVWSPAPRPGRISAPGCLLLLLHVLLRFAI